MYNTIPRQNTVSKARKERQQNLKITSYAIGFFSALIFLLIDFYALPPFKLPFFPPDVCMAFITAPLEAQDGCGPCDGAKCPSPCPEGKCPEGGIVGPCPAGSSTEPETGYGNPATPGGPVCKVQQVSPGDLGYGVTMRDDWRMCPTGMPPGTKPLPPGFKALSAEDYCQEVCPGASCGRGVIDDAGIGYVRTIMCIDDIMMGTSASYAVLRGRDIYKTPKGKERTTVLILYSCIIYLGMSWWPHIRMHMYLATPVFLCVADLLFHLPFSIVSMILMAYSDKAANLNTNVPWPFQHRLLSRAWLGGAVASIIGLISFGIGYGVIHGSAGQVFFGLVPGWLAALADVVYFLEAMMFGGSIVYLICSLRVVFQTKKRFWNGFGLVLGLFFLGGNWFIHITLHNTMPTPWTVSSFLLVDFLFHVPNAIATHIVCLEIDYLVDVTDWHKKKANTVVPNSAIVYVDENAKPAEPAEPAQPAQPEVQAS